MYNRKTIELILEKSIERTEPIYEACPIGTINTFIDTLEREFKDALDYVDTLREIDSQDVEPNVSIINDDLCKHLKCASLINIFSKDGIITVKDLLSKTERELLSVPSFGMVSLGKVQDFLKINNLELGGKYA